MYDVLKYAAGRVDPGERDLYVFVVQYIECVDDTETQADMLKVFMKEMHMSVEEQDLYVLIVKLLTAGNVESMAGVLREFVLDNLSGEKIEGKGLETETEIESADEYDNSGYIKDDCPDSGGGG